MFYINYPKKTMVTLLLVDTTLLIARLTIKLNQANK